MKIIIATPLFPPEIEDISTYAKDLAQHLKEKHQVSVLAYAGQVETIPGVTIHTINKRLPRFFRIFNYFIKLNNLAKGADYIIAINAVASGLPAVLVKMFTGKPVIINFFEDEAWKRARYLHLTNKSWEQFLAQPEVNGRIGTLIKLQAWVLRRADKIVVSSETLAEAVTKAYHLPSDKVMVNYSVATAPIILPFEQTVKKNQVLVFGQDFDLINQEKINGLSLIVLGSKSLSRAEISYLINTSELIVYNVQSENFDNFLIDCVVADKNILAHDTSYTQEIIGKSGVFVDFNNKQAVFEKIHQLLGHRVVNKDTNNRFVWENHLNKLEEIFKKVL